MTYAPDSLHAFAEHLGSLPLKMRLLQGRLLTLNLRSPRAREYALHGVARRLRLLERCLLTVFRKLPPEQTRPPSEAATLDATIALQGFLINLSGAIDGLAWVWVHETSPRQNDGRPLRQHQVGLDSRFKELRDGLPSQLQRALTPMDPWFENLKDRRDAQAHRIPIYIPRYTIPKSRAREYHELEKEFWAATAKVDERTVRRVLAAQRKIARFDAVALHSQEEAGGPFLFHAQMIADFLTIEVLVGAMVDAIELQRSNEKKQASPRD